MRRFEIETPKDAARVFYVAVTRATQRLMIGVGGDQLAQEFGRGFEAKNLRRMLQFAVAFPDTEKVASLMRHLSWTHFLQLLPVNHLQWSLLLQPNIELME
jgi:ATP-dependent exoDNAse (exonuclease V) beta subunit